MSNVNGITDMRISSFTIEELSERFYANGRHQCHIRISVLKVGRNSNWQEVKVPLSDLERSSIRPVNISSSVNNNSLSLPAQWTSHFSRNIYDLGLINTAYSKPRPGWRPDEQPPVTTLLTDAVFADEKTTSCAECNTNDNSSNELKQAGETEIFNANNVPDIFDLYISSSATGTQQLMATMQFEEVNEAGSIINTRTLTTNMSDNHGNNFSSSIRLTAIPPVIINSISPVLRTIQNREEDVTKWDTHHQVITLYTWQLPFNLRSISRTTGNTTERIYALGNTHENNRFLTRGRFFAVGTSNVNARDYMDPDTGCVWDFGYRVVVSDRQICADVLHVEGCSWTSPMRPGSHVVELIDNYGTEHRFTVSPMNTGKELTLSRTGN